jgi:hypothetical protein
VNILYTKQTGYNKITIMRTGVEVQNNGMKVDEKTFQPYVEILVKVRVEPLQEPGMTEQQISDIIGDAVMKSLKQPSNKQKITK